MNTAARLEAAAPVMGVAVGGGRGDSRASEQAITYEELPPVEAKGKAEPVRVWRAVPPIAGGVGTPPLGATKRRSSAATSSSRCWCRCLNDTDTAQRPEFVTIVGEPGLGKSRLVREVGPPCRSSL